MEKIVFSSLYKIPSKNGITRPSSVRGQGYKMINMGEIFANDRLRDIEMERVLLSDKEKKTFKVEKYDLLFARQSIVAEGAGKCSIVLDVSNLTCFESHIIRVRLNQELASPEYFYYFFQSEFGKAYLSTIRQQGVQAGIRGSDLQRLLLPTPEHPTQKKIASILSAYDDLIDNNFKQIKMLEEVAQLTFNEWFGKTKGLPSGWQESNLGSLVGHEIGGGWGEENQSNKFSRAAYVIRGTDIDEIPYGKLEGIPFRYHKKSNLASRKLEDGDIIFEVSGGSTYEGVAKTLLVTDGLLKQFNNDVMCASFCKLLRPASRALSSFIFLFLRLLREIKGTEVFEVRSASNIVNYNWSAFLKFQKVKVPDDKTLKDFNEIIDPFYKQIYTLGHQNRLLKEARDILLPRLMTGMIEV